MQLVVILPDGAPASSIAALSPAAIEACQAYARLYAASRFEPPWNGYLALENDQCVGTCGFKSPPRGERVEIAYCTFAGHEGRGVATRMVQALIELARRRAAFVVICAQTLSQDSASTHILQKLGFQHTETLDDPEDGRVWEWRLVQ